MGKERRRKCIHEGILANAVSCARSLFCIESFSGFSLFCSPSNKKNSFCAPVARMFPASCPNLISSHAILPFFRYAMLFLTRRGKNII